MSQKPYLKLLEESFPGVSRNIERCEALGYRWEASQLFLKAEHGKVVSHVALLECPVLIEGHWQNVGTLHAICTQKDYRGQGLASELIQEALEWAENRCETVLLFTEIPAFYEKLSFQKIQEYCFYLPISHPKGSQLFRPMTVSSDHSLFSHIFVKIASPSFTSWSDVVQEVINRISFLSLSHG